jgi:hypothetical protein
MAGSTFKKKNKNRFKKVYPYIRRAPVYELVSDAQSVSIETSILTFTNSSSETYTFAATFLEAPIVTVTTVDSESNDTANVNAVVSSVTATSVTVQTSQTFTGTVHIHAISIIE